MSPQTVHQFAEKVALVSDAASPIGRAVAMQLALQGSYVIGLFPDADGAENPDVSELVELGTLAHGFAIDPTTREGSAQAAAEIERVFGRLDLLVNCLKSSPESSFDSRGDAEFAATVGRDIGAAYFLTKCVLRLMKDRPKPKVVFTASRIDAGADPLFEATQAAVVGLAEAFAAVLPTKFRVNCVVMKDAAREATGGELLFRPAAAVAPDDVARAVLFLLSSESTGIKGQSIRLG